MRHLAGIALAIVVLVVATRATAATELPVAQQNALVQKHCAVCHTDRTPNGGLSLQHFDATEVAPSLAAMMLSKLTSGLPLQTIARASSDEAAEGLLTKRLFGGAIMAAGVVPPDIATIRALSAALAARAATAGSWQLSRGHDPTSKMPRATVSVVREVARQADVVESYRLLLTCNEASGEGHMQLAWSPVATTGAFSMIVDGVVRGPYVVEGQEAMGNGTGMGKGLAAFQFPSLVVPSRALVVRGLFPHEEVDFSFADLPAVARKALEPCVTGR